jgi:dipeptidyl aminopeptidase/acylaminoacyl peptidase
MPERRPFTVETSLRRTLHGSVDLPDQPGPRPTVVDCHGFKGFMDWGFHPYLADLLAARGFAVVRFNFTSSGMVPGDELVTDERAFATTTFGDDVDEIHAVLAALTDGILARGRVDPERLALLGHSRGGGTSILTAASEAWSGRLSALVTWAAVGTFDRIGAEDKERWRRLGALPIVNARTGQQLELDRSLLDDGEARKQDYDLEAAAARRTAPWLLLHGDEDETVPVAEAHALAAAAGGEFEIHVVEGGSHTFGAQHPFTGPTPQLIEAMNRTQLWLRGHLMP